MKKFNRLIGAALTGILLLSCSAIPAGAVETEEELPARYDSRDYGYITPVKNQGSYGTCWAHGTVAACEASLIKNNGFAKDLDLSEYHLAYCTSHQMSDRLGLFPYNPQFSGVRDDYLKSGNLAERAGITLACWNGVVLNDAHHSQFCSEKLQYSDMDLVEIGSKELQYCIDTAHLTDFYLVDPSDITKMKQYIMQFGAGEISVQGYGSGVDTINGVILMQEGMSGTFAHSMCVVGWDDTIPAEQLCANGYLPHQDGAFIVKNSWGTWSGKDGYYYIPYEDYTLAVAEATFFEFDTTDTFTLNYGYDCLRGTNACSVEQSPHYVASANVFTANADDETLQAVGFFNQNQAISYEVKVYTDLPDNSQSPEDGTLRATVTGETLEKGYRTVRLSEPVSLKAGERFAVAVGISTGENETALLSYAVPAFDKREQTYYSPKVGESYYYSADGWKDETKTDNSEHSGYPRIKAFTHSDSMAACEELDVYWQFDGKSKQAWLQELEAVNQYGKEIQSHSEFFRSNEPEVINRFVSLNKTIQEHADLFSAAEICATMLKYDNFLSNIKTASAEQFLGVYQVPVSMFRYGDPFIIPMDSPPFKRFSEACSNLEKEIETHKLDEGFAVTEAMRKEVLDSFYAVEYYRYDCNNNGLMGDLNNDGLININDVTLRQRWLAFRTEPFDFYFYAHAQILPKKQHDSIQEITAMQRYLAQYIDHMPVYDSTFGLMDGLTADTDKETLVAYLRKEVEKKSAWDAFALHLDDKKANHQSVENKVKYDKAKEVLADADNQLPYMLLYQARRLRATVPASPPDNY